MSQWWRASWLDTAQDASMNSSRVYTALLPVLRAQLLCSTFILQGLGSKNVQSRLRDDVKCTVAMNVLEVFYNMHFATICIDATKFTSWQPLVITAARTLLASAPGYCELGEFISRACLEQSQGELGDQGRSCKDIESRSMQVALMRSFE